MQEVAEVLHRAKSGRLIVRMLGGEKTTAAGSILVDEKGRRVAKLMELIGPVSKPYGSAATASDRHVKEGQKLFLWHE